MHQGLRNLASAALMFLHHHGIYEWFKSLGLTLGCNSQFNSMEVTNHLSVQLGKGNKFVSMGKQI
jgi:hypothetical protein